MKRYILAICLLTIGIFLQNCSTQENTQKAVEENPDNLPSGLTDTIEKATVREEEAFLDTLFYEIQTIQKKVSNCDEDDCTNVLVNYPYFSKNNATIINILNAQIAAILSEILGGYVPDDRIKPNSDVEQMAKGIVDEYLRMKAEYPEERPWSVEINGEVVFQNERFVSVNLAAYDYMGGVHPNSAQRNICLNVESGNLLSLDEIINDYDKLVQLGEKAFREAVELEPDDDLSAAGYNFPDNTFTLNENFMLTKEGINFHFNPYEIAPYVLGHTDVDISYEELEGILKDK